MNSVEFSVARRRLGKSQAQMAQLLGISVRSVQSFEQNWRKIPATAERQALFLLYMKAATKGEFKPCWQKKSCDLKTRRRCPAWELGAGNLCWFINGTICDGKPQGNWNNKMQICRRCGVFTSLVPPLISRPSPTREHGRLEQ